MFNSTFLQLSILQTIFMTKTSLTLKEILLKVALNTIMLPYTYYIRYLRFYFYSY